MDLVVEGYKSGGCSGGGVFVSWIEAWDRLREEWDKKKKKEESSFTQKKRLERENWEELKDEEGYFCLIRPFLSNMSKNIVFRASLLRAFVTVVLNSYIAIF